MKVKIKYNKKAINLNTYFLFIKQYYKKFLIFLGLSLINFISLSANIYVRPSSQLENFSSLISFNAKNNAYKLQNLSIDKENDKDDRIKNFFSSSNRYSFGNDCFSNALIVAKQSKDINQKLLSNLSEEKPVSILFPRTISVVKTKTNGFKLESIDLELYNNCVNVSSLFCYVSDVYANELLEKKHCDTYDDIIGEKVQMQYSLNGSIEVVDLAIAAIYKTTTAKGSYYYDLFGEFIITNLGFRTNIDNFSISFDLNRSIYNNSRALTILENEFPVSEYEWNFIENTPNNYLKDIYNLNEEYAKYINFDYDSINWIKILTYVIFFASTILTLLFLIFLNVKLENSGYYYENHKIYNRVFIFGYYLLFFILYLVAKIFGLSKFILSNTVGYWLLLGIIFTVFINIPSLVRKKGKNGED